MVIYKKWKQNQTQINQTKNPKTKAARKTQPKPTKIKENPYFFLPFDFLY